MAQNSLTSTSSKEIVLSLKIDGGNALKTVVEAEKNVHDLKEQIKELNKEYKGKENEEYYKKLVQLKTELKDQQNTLKANQRILDEQVKAYKKNEDSINSMRANLKLLRAQYEDMSKAERDSAKGDELVNKIKKLSDEIKNLEAKQGDFRSNVGNYQDIWNASAEQIKSFGDTFNSVFGGNNIFVQAIKQVQHLGQDISRLAKEWDEDAKKTKAQAESNASATTKAYTEVGKSIQNVGETAKDETIVVQGFGKALYDTNEPAKEAATSMNETAKAAENLNKATNDTSEAANKTSSFGDKLHNVALKIKDGFITGAKAVGQFAKQLLSLLANPIVAAFAAIAVVVMKLVKAFKANDQAMTELKAAFSAFQPVLNFINSLFEKLVGTVTKVVSVLGKAAKAIGNFFGGEAYRKQQEQAENLVRGLDALEDREREYSEAHAKNEAKISDLREKASDAENYTLEQRKQFLKESEDIERADLDEKRAIAQERLDIETQLALQEKGYTEMTAEAWNSLTDEVKNHIVELRNAVTSVDKEMTDFERNINRQTAALTKRQNASGTSAAQAKKERIKNEQEALQALEEMYISTIKDMYAKEEAALRSSNKKQIEQIQLKLNTEKNLTSKAREALNKQIVLLEAKLQSDIYDLREKYQNERLKNKLEEQKAWYETLLNGVRGQAKETVDIELVKINTKMAEKSLTESLDNMKKIVSDAEKDFLELDYNELAAKYGSIWDFYGINLGDNISNMRAMIDMYNRELIEKEAAVSNTITELHKQEELNIIKIKKEGQLKREELAQQYADTIATITETRDLESFYYNEVEKTKILQEQAQRRLDITKQEYDRIANLTQDEQKALYETDEEYKLAVAEAELNVANAEVALADAMRATTQAIQDQKEKTIETFTAIASSVSDVISNVQSIFETLAESDEKYRKYSTALAMMNILVSTATSIASAVQAATTAGGFTGPAAPVTIPVFIAELVAVVTSAIASATQLLKKAQSSAPAKPRFGGGGLVGNKTTTKKDDTIDAKLSEGEYVIQSRIVKKYGVGFFDSINEKRKRKFDIPLRFSDGGVVPSVATIQSAQSQIDYSQMREMFTQVVQEIQPVVSVREINSMQNRVNVKEQTASYN